ncbi:MAG: hypothetical protein MUC31_06205 [Bacteroidales bacterium]|jgi:hypothetical protein|nr:hypothetical protein [Bacteroidales bacterium]
MKICFLLILLFMLLMFGCNKDADKPTVDPSDKLALDSLVATKKHIVTWEEINVKAYARGESLKYEWYTNHGSMVALDSVTVLYWACPSCEGLNIIECTVSNKYGSISDTVMIQVDPDHGL